MTNDRLRNTVGGKLDIIEIKRGLGTRVLGQRMVYHESVGSTNDIAKQLAEAGEAEGTLVITDEQTAGRGRLGRTWIAPARSSILMSLILRPALAPHQIARVTMAVSLGACDGIRDETGLDARIKWPNDILLKGKKCAGILSEAGTVGDQVEYVVVGLGVNVNFSIASAAGVPRGATTISDELGRAISRERLTQALVRETERYYTRLQAGEDLRTEWKSRMITLGKRVRAELGHEVEEGIAEDVDEDGALLLRRADESLARLIVGDVTLHEP